MSKITFELDDTYTSKLTSLATNATIEDTAKEIVIDYINSHTSNSSKPNKPVGIDRRILGI